MIWMLLLLGVILIGLGAWGGPAPGLSRARDRIATPDRETEPDREAGPLSHEEAWTVLTRPVQEEAEVIKLPERQPRFGPDRRFLQGLLVGIGSGLLFAALAAVVWPRPVAPTPLPPVVRTEPPVQPAPLPAPAPVPTTPPPVTAPQPANVTVVVEPGDMAPTVASRLKTAGLIADEQAFLTRLEALGLDTRLRAGTFVIRTGATLDEVIQELTT